MAEFDDNDGCLNACAKFVCFVCAACIYLMAAGIVAGVVIVGGFAAFIIIKGLLRGGNR